MNKPPKKNKTKMIYTLSNHHQKLTIDTLGAQILSWQKLQNSNNSNAQPVNILVNSNNPKRSGMPIMFPFCGPLKDNVFQYSGQIIPQHGFARSSQFQLKSQTKNTITMSLQSQDLDPIWQVSYPFVFELLFEVKLFNSGIIVSLKLINQDNKDIPVSPGFHPYFAVEQKSKTNIKISNTSFDAQLLPWFTGVEAQFLRNPSQYLIQTNNWKLSCTDNSSLSCGGINQSLPCQLLTVWAGEVADFVCIEPMSQPFDSINTSPILVPVSGVYDLNYQFEF